MNMCSLVNKRICIIGAGVVGLSTAYRLIELFADRRLDITILAKEFGRDTTSDGAGGLFRPDDRFMPGVDKKIAKFWSNESFKFYDRLLFSKEGGKAGIFQMSGYQIFNDKREDPTYKDMIYNFRHLNEDELKIFPHKFNYGYFCTTICVDARAYMKYLTDILVQNGVKFESKAIQKLFSFIEESNYDIYINCMGMDADQVCDDNKVFPIRGQMIRVKAPWLKHFYYSDDNCYIIPNQETVCLGGTRQVGDYRKNVDEDDKKAIFERCKKICPSLENAKVEWDWAGLRPVREPTRVEKEIYNKKNGQTVTIIHNYGHGGNGISLSRGTAVHAINLIFNIDNNDVAKAKL